MAGEIFFGPRNRSTEALQVAHDLRAALFGERWRRQHRQKQQAQGLVYVKPGITLLAAGNIQLPVHARDRRPTQTVINLLRHRPRMRGDRFMASNELRQFPSSPFNCVTRPDRYPIVRSLDARNVVARDWLIGSAPRPEV